MAKSPDLYAILYAISKEVMGKEGDPAIKYWLSTGCLQLDLAIRS